LGIAEKP